jgi:hypothetical protein
MEVLGSAALTERITADRAVTAVFSREEIASVLEDESASAELLLHVVRADEAGGKEQGTISIDWSRQELESLLERATGDRVVLTFDREQLEQALADVEAHGLRERALIFAVAATGALGAGAGIANAMPTLTDVSSTGGYAAVSTADARVTDASSAGGYAAEVAAADQLVSDASSAGGYAAEAAAADQLVSDASSAGGYVADTADQMVSDASSAGGYQAPSDPFSAEGGLTFEMPSSADGAIVGGLVLTIAAAAFTSRRRKPERTV